MDPRLRHSLCVDKSKSTRAVLKNIFPFIWEKLCKTNRTNWYSKQPNTRDGALPSQICHDNLISTVSKLISIKKLPSLLLQPLHFYFVIKFCTILIISTITCLIPIKKLPSHVDCDVIVASYSE